MSEIPTESGSTSIALVLAIQLSLSILVCPRFLIRTPTIAILIPLTIATSLREREISADPASERFVINHQPAAIIAKVVATLLLGSSHSQSDFPGWYTV